MKGYRGRYEFGDALKVLRTVPDETFHCCVTSPPYWGLRDYGHEGQLGLEATPEEYVAKMVEVFRTVRRVLRDDGTLWLNLGDSYAAGSMSGATGINSTLEGGRTTQEHTSLPPRKAPHGLKPKDLVGIPWRVAFALQADGWYLRSDIIWNKPNPMPESVTDRPTKAHEYVFLMSKSARYYYDAEAIKEPAQRRRSGNHERKINGRQRVNRSIASSVPWTNTGAGRNRRSVWTVATKPYNGAHFATFPPSLVAPCILAGCPEDGIVLDPFFGTGTTGMVAEKLGRSWFGIELNPEFEPLIRDRTAQLGLFSYSRAVQH